jgi:hypothetical protein
VFPVPSSTSSSSGSFFFIVRVLLAAAAIFAAYNVLLEIVQPRFTPGSDDGLRNRVIAERYFDGDVPPAVIVGSSVAFRLAPDFQFANVLGPKIYDLAFGGGGPASGLKIILNKRNLPRIVLVEANVPYRPVDPIMLRKLVAEPRATLRRYLPALRLENRPVDLFIAAVWAGLRKQIVRDVAPAGAVEPESPAFASRLAVTRAHNAVISDKKRAEIEAGIDTLGALVDALKARNIRVIFFYLPMHPAIEASVFQRFVREHMAARFPETRYNWISIPDASSYRTEGGMHLTRPSGRRLATFLRHFVENALTP